MVFLRGVEIALGIVLLVDLIKALVPNALRAWVKLLLTLVFAVAGSIILTAPSNWRYTLASSLVAIGLAPIFHELHSVLSINVDKNVRQVVQLLGSTSRRRPPQL